MTGAMRSIVAGAIGATPSSSPSSPVRVQRTRLSGWRMPEKTVYVGRGSVWGNPYRLDDLNMPWGRIADSKERAQQCVAHYRCMATEGFITVPHTILQPHERQDGLQSVGAHRITEVAAKYLRGKNLACWCALDMPCHADVLLEWARQEEAT